MELNCANSSSVKVVVPLLVASAGDESSIGDAEGATAAGVSYDNCNTGTGDVTDEDKAEPEAVVVGGALIVGERERLNEGQHKSNSKKVGQLRC